MAEQAESAGLDLLVLLAAPPGEPGLDPWTVASWVAARTVRLQVGLAHDPLADGLVSDEMRAKALAALDALAGPRVVSGADAWVVLPAGSGVDRVAAVDDGRAVVVAVSTPQEVGAVAALRSALPAGRSNRSAAARARRRPGIAYDDLPPSLAARAVEPGDPAYAAVSSTYLRGGAPGLVLRPTTVAEVADAVRFAGRHPTVPLGVRSGGHGVSGRSTNRGGIVVDVGALRSVEVVDPARRLVRVGPGATWKQVAAALHPHGWALGSGDYGGVGVGGLATAGGIGLLSREHGLTIDHVRAAEVVLADGSVVHASANKEPELFWAVRGAGANVGVVTSFDLEVDEVGTVGWAQLRVAVTDLADALLRFGELATSAPRDTTIFLVAGRPHGDHSFLHLYGLVDSDDPDVVVERLTPFAELGVLVDQQVVLAAYRDVMGSAADVGPDGHRGFGEPAARSGFLRSINAEVAADVTRMLAGGDVHFFQLRTMGGAIADVAPGATAFAHRDAAFQVTAMGAAAGPLDAAWAPVRRHLTGLYLSFETGTGPEVVELAFPPATLARLREVKRCVDPTNRFHDNFNVLGVRPDLEAGQEKHAS
ncbi:FAD-binding oxidoreductase [Nocardioides sp. SYSU D00038]|uniref:FAD-binding oxidoreductase n=1 Tax=Nocardioides sp. SYSU D00038 TaxID=2812554 RepID=UPI001966D0FE|nr:FAD-binding oxidoreductase [Nocardioides sp. SYSU D00038]